MLVMKNLHNPDIKTLGKNSVLTPSIKTDFPLSFEDDLSIRMCNLDKLFHDYILELRDVDLFNRSSPDTLSVLTLIQRINNCVVAFNTLYKFSEKHSLCK